ncbi:arylsulfatase [Shewanella electrodiphila]|uniref:Arylsulfatase n=1 Tax=Shewanella electrodiphila TaxID=934143 RepID=A0ABT0KMF8_9GAMM|nr:arylsulfatase [Shewanella electrodiphila]MCL1045032.1 arylsulfatase [Shewanella electrodiphila]
MKYHYSIGTIIPCLIASLSQPVLSKPHLASSSNQQPERPNIVLIMADDLGLGDVSYYTRDLINGKPLFETPTLDQLSQQGLWFSDAHATTALCSPTRYGMMTGNSTYRSNAPWGTWSMYKESPFKKTDATIGRIGQTQGYNTGFIGKWHLGGDYKTKEGSTIYRGEKRGYLPKVDLSQIVGGGPEHVGFEYSFMLPDGIQGPNYMAFENSKWYPLTENSKVILIDESSAVVPEIVSSKGPGMGDSAWDTRKMGDIISQKAVDYIHRQNNKKPFLLYYASPMPHLPHIPPATFDGVKVKGSTPTAHLDMIVELDLQIARIVKALKAKGMYDNTLLMITSDNGGLLFSQASGHRASGEYRDGKNSAYEGGHRVPFIIHWPEMISKGEIVNEPIMAHDVVATIAAVTGFEANENQMMDSMNLLPLFDGKTELASREFMLQQGGTDFQVVLRKEQWKLIIKTNRNLTDWKPVALFDLDANKEEHEQKNLINNQEFKVLAENMLAQYLNIRSSGMRTTPLL